MPTERLSMRQIRDLLRLDDAQGLSERAIALSLGLGKSTFGGYLARGASGGFVLPAAAGTGRRQLGFTAVSQPNPAPALRPGLRAEPWLVRNRQCPHSDGMMECLLDVHHR